MSDELSENNPKPHRKLTKAEKITMVVMTIVFIGIVGILTHGSTPATQNTPVDTSPSDLKVSQPISMSENEPAPHTPTTVFDLAARGTNQSQKFTVNGDWDLKWSYDCTSEGTGNFIVYIYNADGTMSTETMVNQLGASDSGTNHYYDSGTYYFSVVSGGCSWHLTVIN